MNIFLDLDNTIFPSKFAYEYALERLEVHFQQKYKVPFRKLYEKKRAETKEQLLNHSSNRLRILYFKKMFDELFGTLSIKESLNLEEKYFHFFLEGARSFYKINNKDFKDLYSNLNLIAKKNQIAILTNENLRTQLLKLNIFFPAFSTLKIQLFCSEEIGVEKPSKEFFEYCLKKMKSKPKDTIMIGDSLKDDIEGAMNQGINAIHVLEMFGDYEYLKENQHKKKKYQEVKNVNRALELVR